MALFQYKAMQLDGSLAEGQLEAGGRQEAFRQMEARGLKPINLAEKTGGKSAPAGEAVAKPGLSFGSGKVSSKMLENFTRLLSSLLAAGVPLSRALVILCKETSSPAAGVKWKQVYDSVVDGVALADAMALHPETFPRVYVAMVEAGETGGFLDVVLAQIAEFQARDKELRSKVLSAMFYPIILFFFAILVVALLMVFFIPRFQKIFAGFGGKLPLITQVIITASDAIRSYGLFILVGAAVFGFAGWNWFKSEKGRRIWERFLLRSPIIGPLVGKFAMARFCRMLGTLIGAGVPLVQGLNVARKSIGNQILVDAVSNSIDRVKEGGQLGKSLGECRDLFSGSTLEMISVAEESGRLDQELIRISNVTEGDLDRQLKTAVSLLEPLMLFLIAGFIGAIFIGMILPIYTMQDHIK
jgi:type IV pilus assembly protein PilC